jgi:hypothetical protein
MRGWSEFSARRIAAGLLLALASAAGSAAAAADTIAMRVEVYGLVGLHVLRLQSQIEQTNDRYSITVDYATTGVAGLFVDQKTHAVAQGWLTNGVVRPHSFRNVTRRDGAERRNRVDYQPDGTVEGSSAPTPAELVSPEAMRGTVDNLSAYLRLERQLAAKGTCELTVPVFDGRFRYDLIFADAGRQKLSPEGDQKFDGSAIACRMTRKSYGGGSEQGEGARKGTIWYAALVPGDIVIPVRMRLDTQIGSVDAYLAELHGRGIDLKLME